MVRLASPLQLLCSGQPGRTLAAANFAGDQRHEILAGDSSDVRVLSATTGAVLRTFPDVPSGQFALLGDVNADGVPDLARRRPAYLSGTIEYCDLDSGSSVALLAHGPQLAGLRVALQAFYVPTLAPLGFDINNGIWATLGYRRPTAWLSESEKQPAF